MFVKVDDKDNVLQYPYSAGNLRMDFPTVSFPADFNDEAINELGVYRVEQTERPAYDDTVKKLVDSVELVNEKWVQKWLIENVNEELAIFNVKRRRDALLTETDWMALIDTTLTPEWAAYRQALRDVPDQEGFPFVVEWPVKPA